jgi:hypothetical protein
MKDKVVLYISSAPELRLERSVLSKAVSEIPTSLGWRILQTPTGEKDVDLDSVLRADVHVLVLGEDVKAPVGLEWQYARRAGHQVAVFNKDTLRTRAGESFKRELAKFGEWRAFKDALDLKRQVLALLVDHLITHAEPYVLSADEINRLRAWLKAQSNEKPTADDLTLRTGSGTNESGVILSTERFVPSDGVLLRSGHG